MKISLKSNSHITVVIALLVLLGSSGLTTLIRTCTMGDMSCCAGLSSVSKDDCDASALPALGVVLKADLSCSTTKLVGGLAINLALVEKENKLQMHATGFNSIAAPSFNVETTHSKPSHHHFAFNVPHAPPSVDRYVLNGSFLI